MNIFNGNKSLFLFIISFIISLSITYLINPSILQYPQFWAEEGIFYSNILKHNAFETLLLKDWGLYFNVLTRIIVLLVHFALISIDNIPLAYHLIGATFIGLCTSIFCFERFRCIIEQDYFRFFLCILFNLNFDNELRYINNIAYYGVIPIILFIVYSEYITRFFSLNKSILFSFFVFILFCSKPIFLALSPIFIFLLYREIKLANRSFSRIIVPLSAILGSVLQFFSYISVNFFNDLIRQESVFSNSLTNIMKQTIFDFLSIPIGNSFGIIYFKILPLNITTLIISFMIFVIIFVILRLKSNNKIIFNLFIFFCIASLLNAFFVSAAGFIPPQNATQLDHLNSRRFYLSSVFFIFLFYILVFYLINNFFLTIKIKYIPLLLLVIHVNVNNVFRIQKFNSFKFPIIGVASWEEDYNLISYENYCIPIDPFPWIINKNCNIINRLKFNLINYIETKDYKSIKVFKKLFNFQNKIYDHKIQSILILAPKKIAKVVPILKIDYGFNNTIYIKPKPRKSHQGFYRYQFPVGLSHIANIQIVNNAYIPLKNNYPIVVYFGWRIEK